MHVLKFGGTSLGNAKRLSQVCQTICKRLQLHPVAVVVSAIAGVTNMLELSIQKAKEDVPYTICIDEMMNFHQRFIDELAHIHPNLLKQELESFIFEVMEQYSTLLQGVQLIKDCPEKIHCKILSFGEVISTQMVRSVLGSLGITVTFLDATSYIKTKGPLSEAIPIMPELMRLFAKVKNNTCLLMSGFIASDMAGNLSLLGRNGSDYSASLMAVALNAESCEIWTDVDGIYTADPNQVPDAKLIRDMSYGEAMELAFYGAKILHPKTTAVLVSAQIPLFIKNSFKPEEEGTKISAFAKPDQKDLIRAVSYIKDIALINIYGAGMKGSPGMAARVFDIVAKCGVSVILISQASSEYSICFCVIGKDAEITYKALQEALYLELQAKIVENIEVMHDQAIICIVGDEMRTRYGIAGKFFSSLAHACINIVAIAQGSSERCISAVINGHDSAKAVHAVHRSFFHTLQTIELYIVGIGSVGSELIEQIKLQHHDLLRNGIEIKVCAIANTRKYVHRENGIDLANWSNLMHSSSNNLKKILAQASLDKPLNGILLDCTASKEISSNYIAAFKAGLHVISANKQANSSTYAYYQELRAKADKYKRLFLYETNVGAGLPIIYNFKNLIKSGDQLLDFSGILSGSLSFIFGALEDDIPFSEAVNLARDKKFTEPDPRDDLSGIDVARKLLILAREIGLQIEFEDIQVDAILPLDFDISGSIDTFLLNLKKIDSYFSEKTIKLRQKNKVLRLVGEIKNHKCRVGICVVDKMDPLYSVKNGENAFVFLTKRYSPIPFVIRGYGAGVGVTASGLFGDILKTVSLN
ncbi:MAG: bifunctional aspartate kinase/homoserine dehydrogenase I [Proteobacteria bacterium]|nr:bifunctional aspartate kinase/homoserine dehydrogenase I [Pseudomonadota bacterium]